MQILKAFHLLVSIALIVFILLQSGKSAGLSGAIDGGASQFFGKAKGWDAKLSRLTTITAVVFMLSSVLLALL
ncbi:MAG: preprotein translocase subunit SecG [Bacillota bacterium]